MGNFMQTQILGMEWLSTLIGRLLSSLGLDIESRIGSSIHDFFVDGGFGKGCNI
ncbi:hypothetical protein SAMN02910339_01401 [Lachnospiraceae bacterium YSD2013]|nr:hypothetical protein SAMN02910339_01401 [Lachnospiraceae bacterium YSD2013]